MGIIRECSQAEFDAILAAGIQRKTRSKNGQKKTTKKAPKNEQKSGSKKGPLDKLAQLAPLPDGKKVAKVVEINKLAGLTKRARAKYIGDAIKFKLLELHSPKKSAYFKSCLCASTLHQSGDKITSRYCNQRWCIVCSRIRTARAINGYHSQLESIGKLWFLTLTVPNMRSFDLSKSIKEMNKQWRQITHKAIKKTALKNTAFNGIRKLEVTYNLQRNDYHPHFHIIIDQNEVATYILTRWLARYPEANLQAQNLKKIKLDEKEETLKEMFKYSTKFHSTYIDENGKKQTGISAYHLDIIFRCLHNVRTYQPFGNIKRVSEEIEDLEAEVIDGIAKRKTEWCWNTTDWYNIDDGDCLTFYEPTEKDAALKENIKLVKPIHKKTLKKVEKL